MPKPRARRGFPYPLVLGCCLRLVALLLPLLFLSTSLGQSTPPKTIRVVMDNNYPPFVFLDSEGNLKGVLIDQWHLWEKKTGITAEIHALDWDEALRRMQAGEFDVIDTVFETEARKAWLDFSQPYTRIEVPIFFQKNISGVTDLKSLKGFPVATKAGDAAETLLKENGIQTIILFKNYEQIIEAAREHKVNVFVVDEPPAHYYLNKLALQNEFRRTTPINVGEFHRAVKKGDSLLLATVEKGFAAVTPAEAKQIEEKWYGTPVGNSPNLRSFAYIAIAAVVVILLLAVWNRTLSLQVNSRTAALKESKSRLRALLDHIPDWVWLKDTNSRFITANASLARAVQLSPETLVGRTDAELWPTQDTQKFVADDQAVLQSGQPVRLTETITDLQGNLRWLETVKAPVRTTEGVILGTVGIARDITERKQSEAMIQGQKEILEHIAASRPLPQTLDALVRFIESQAGDMLASILLLDNDGVHLRHGAAPSLPQEYIRAVDGSAIGPNAGSCGTAAFRREQVIVEAIATDPLWTGYRSLALPYGLQASWSTPIFDSQQKVLGTFALYFRTPGRPTDRHLQLIAMATQTAAIAISRQQAEESLRHSEERFRQVVENIQEVFWMTDVEVDRMLYVSPAYENIWGRTCESLYRSPETWLESIHPEDRERVVQSGRTKRTEGHYEEEYRIVRPDGSIRWVYDRAFPIRNAEGKIYRVAGVAEDITERHQLEGQFRQSQKMEAIGQLAGGVAHDFNNILAAMMLQADMAASHEGLPAEVMEFLNDIKMSTERAANLTRQLLAFSRQQVMQPRSLDLNEIVTSLAKMLQRILREDIHLQLNLHPTPLFTHADAGMLDQVLMNLAVNARDAMPKGGRLIIETTAHSLSKAEAHLIPEAEAGRFVCLRVTDNGCGISRENLSRIFEPFFTTKEPGKGTGLGLATVFGIVKQHRGSIKVHSQPGEGTTFTVFLPVNESTPIAAAREKAKPEPRGGTETVMVVEDEPEVRALSRIMLERHGYKVLEAADGVEALRIRQQYEGHVHLLLTDMVMPGGVNGRELAHQLQARDPQLRVIFTSGYSADIAGRELVLQPGQFFIQKPCPPMELLETVRRCLDS